MSDADRIEALGERIFKLTTEGAVCKARIKDLEGDARLARDALREIRGMANRRHPDPENALGAICTIACSALAGEGP